MKLTRSGTVDSQADTAVLSLPTQREAYEGTLATSPYADLEVELPPTEPATPPAAAPEPRRRRPSLLRLLAFAIPVLLVAGGSAAWFLRPQTDAHYLKALKLAGLSAAFPNDTAAVAHAKGFCRKLEGGAPPQGYDSDEVGVRFYCDAYVPGFKVVPTPAQLEAKYLTGLRDGSFGGKFASDAAAVAHAKSFCDGLKTGQKQQGMPVDKVGVDVYCPEFSSGFHVLETATVNGTFTLLDSDPSIYFPSITSSGDGCTGSGGYSDIRPGTTVTVKNGAGKLLAQTSLGSGTGGYTSCEFPFTLDLLEGEDTYVVTVSRRGELNYTFSQLQTNGLALSLGS